MRHRRYIAYILVTVLCLGAFAPGLLGVFPNVAKADAPGTYSDLVWSDFYDLALHHAHTTEELSCMSTVLNVVTQYKDDPLFNIVVINKDDRYGCMGFLRWDDSTGFYIRSYNNGQLQSGGTSQNYNNQYITKLFYFVFQDEVGFSAVNYARSTEMLQRRGNAFDFGTSGYQYIWPTKFEQQGSGYKVYNLRDITAWDTQNAVNSPASILWNPPVEDFEILTFYLGSQLYVTSNKQHLMSQMDPEKMDYDFCVGFYNSTSYTQEFFYFQDFDTVQIKYPGDVINDIVDTIPDFGIYAINITGILSEGYDEIYAALFGSIEDDTTAARATNVPVSLQSEEEREEEQNLNTWNTFNEYHNTYNTTHVIPQSLGDALFGLNGSQIYPCNVMVPRSVWQNSPDHDGGTSFADAPTWLWWFPLIPDNLGFNYNLLDTIILSESSTGEYSVVYWYDDDLTKKFLKVKDQSFEDILQEFDCIIIVPDDDGCLRASTWWRETLAFICNALGFDTPSLLSALGICGSSSLGVQYVEDQPEEFTHELQGYALLTPKAIQKQLLWNFNDGITKLYQLEVDYIESEDKWKDSFLLWSSSVFYAIDSLGGKLDSLITKLGNIEGKLDRLIQNTSEEESSYWFISLWNWVVQFNPSDNDFANSLHQYDDNWNNMPSLPPPSPLPMLPGGE